MWCEKNHVYGMCSGSCELWQTSFCLGFGYEYYGGGSRGRVDDHGEL